MRVHAQDIRPRQPHRIASDDTARDLRRALVSGLAIDPTRIADVLEILDPCDLEDPSLEATFSAIRALHAAGQPTDPVLIAERLDVAGQLNVVGGNAGLTEILDTEATAVNVMHYARRVKRLSLENRARVLHERAAQEPDESLRAKLRDVEDALAAIESDRGDLIDLGFTGERLARLRERAERVSPLPSLLDPEPGLVVLVGKPKVAKTRLALALAQAWCCGVAPWPDAERLPGTRALILSAEQPARRVEQTLRQLDGAAGIPRDRWTDRLVLVARDVELPNAARRLLALDGAGLAALRAGLAAAALARDPFGFVVLDSLSRLKTAEIEENDANGMSAWVGTLQEIAEEFGVYIVLIHHVGHGDRTEARSAGRGSSAIAAVAQVAWLLEDVPADPRIRRLHVQGNAVLTSEIYFRVAGEQCKPGEVHFFRPVDPTEAHSIDDLMAHGEELSISGLAWKVAGRDPKDGTDRPPGPAMQTARELRKRWADDGLVELFKKGQAHMTRRLPEASACLPS